MVRYRYGKNGYIDILDDRFYMDDTDYLQYWVCECGAYNAPEKETCWNWEKHNCE